MRRRILEEQFQQLSPREREVAKLLARGLSTKEIAKELTISSKTVDNHRIKIFQKLQLDNSVQLASFILTAFGRVG